MYSKDLEQFATFVHWAWNYVWYSAQYSSSESNPQWPDFVQKILGSDAFGIWLCCIKQFLKKNVLCITLKNIYKMLILYLYVMAFDDVVVFTLELDFLFKFNSAFCGSQSLLSSEGKARLSSQHRSLLNKCLFKKKLYCAKTDKTVKKVMASLSSSIIRYDIHTWLWSWQYTCK